jgi:UPF0271 protein
MVASLARIDFNLDLGEGFGIWSRENDEDTLITLPSSVNLACGFHAGDPGRMRKAVDAAVHNRVAVGAHPGLPDLLGFGRRALQLNPQEIKDCITYQVGALDAFARAAGITLHHVKLHGHLALQCNRDAAAASAYAEAVAEIGDRLPIYTDRTSEVWSACERAGVRAVEEFYADMPLRRDGSRVAGADSRYGRHPDMTPEIICSRVRDLLVTGGVDAYDGGRVDVQAQTISVHTDGASALDAARAVLAGIEGARWQLSADLGAAGSPARPS